MKTQPINDRRRETALTDKRVRRIKKWLSYGDVVNLAGLARRYGVTRGAIVRIRDGVTFKHVTLDGDGE
jgi:hypothetical protein